MSGLTPERTALSWRRTGLSGVAAAALLLRLDGSLSSTTRAALAAAALLLLGTAGLRGRQLRRSPTREPHPALPALATAAVAAAGLCLIAERL